jgi:hypothetical protein
MKQFKITSEDIAPVDEDGDTYLAPDDPAQEIRRLQFLSGLGGQHRLSEYRQQVAQSKLNQGSNITVTAAENARIMREQNIQPGTPEWFKLWFSKPYLTGETKK